jgi:catalase (peroxidase I)
MFMTVNTSRLIYQNSNYATMRFEPESRHEANIGLHIARGLMEQIKKEFEWISYGDLWTLAGVAAIQVSNRAYISED